MKDIYLWRAIYNEEVYTLLTEEQRKEIDYKIATYLMIDNLVKARDSAWEKYKEYYPEED